MDRLDEKGLAVPLGLVERLQLPPEWPDEREDDQSDEAGEADDDERQLDAVEQQERQEDEERQPVEQGQEEPARKEFADAAGLLHVLDENSGGGLLEQRDRQAQEVRERACRHPDVDAVRRVEQEISAQEGERGVEDEGDADADGEDGQRRIALVDEHLVDHQLEEERRREAERVEDEGGDGDVDEEAPLAQDFRHEPAEAEGLVGVEQLELALQEEDGPAPGARELRLGDEQEFRALRQGVEDPDHLLVAAGRWRRVDHDNPVAVVEAGECRIGLAQPHQRGPGEREYPSLQPAILRHPLDEAQRDRPLVDRIVVNQPLGRDVDPVMPGDGRKALQACMWFLGHVPPARREPDEEDGAAAGRAASRPAVFSNASSPSAGPSFAVPGPRRRLDRAARDRRRGYRIS